MLTRQMLDGLISTVEQAGFRQPPIQIHIHVACGACSMTQTSVTIDETLQQYDGKITAVQQQIEQAREQLHTYRATLTSAIIHRIPEIIEHLCIQAWETKVREDRANSFSQEHDAAFMRDVKLAMQESATVAEHRLQNITYWVYLNPLPDDFSIDHGIRNTLYKTAREQVKRLFREMLGYAGEVLVKHGCMKGNTESWDFRGTSRPYYEGALSFGPVRNALNAYDAEIEQYFLLHLDRYKLIRERKNTEVEMRLEIAQAAC